MSTTSSTPMPATGSLQLIEAVTERLDGAPVSERRRWSDEFKERAVAAALEPGVNVSALARRLGILPSQLFGHPMTVKIVGLDLAKDVFQVHGTSETGRKVFNKKIKRAKLLAFFETLPRCVVGMEACGSAHHWGRELRKLGHDVRLIPAAYVKPYVKRGKTDAADAEAICEAVRRPTMRFVEIKSEEQQAVLAIHRSRDLVVRQRTQVVNMIRSILREFGHILPTGIEAVSAFAHGHGSEDQLAMPEIADGILGVMCHQLLALNTRIDDLSKLIDKHAWLDPNARRLMRMPGIGPITASAIVATIGDAHQFRTGRDLAAWLGLTPLNKSSGGKAWQRAAARP